MSWVDIVVILLAVAAGVSGWRHGVAVALLSFVGVLGGALLGLWLAPLLAQGIESPTTKVVASITVVVLLVALGETTGVFFGRRIRDRIQSENSRRVDSTLGSIVEAITVVIAAWLIALPLASASFPGLVSAVKGSGVLRTVDSVMPAAARSLPDQLRRLLSDSEFPDVLGPFGNTPVTEVGPPDPALQNSPVVRQVQDRVVKIRGKAPSCSRQLEGSGFVVGPERVITNAHVVAGTNEVSVEVRGRQRAARVVSYNADLDIAVLSVSGLGLEPLRFATGVAPRGADAIVLGYPLDGPYRATAAKIRDRIQLRGPDIYDQGTVTRDVYTVRAKVLSGNSGGPMINPAGEVYGVVFGAALDDSETGFVLTAQQVAGEVAATSSRTAGVRTGSCAA
ncbi:MAG: MarP family serine protease [Pseudonocardia sp.]